MMRMSQGQKAAANKVSKVHASDGASTRISARGATMDDVDKALNADWPSPPSAATPLFPNQEDFEQRFNICLGCVISLNVILIAVEIDWGPRGDGVEAKNRIGWIIVDSIFTLIFLAELVFRVYRERAQWIYSTWNWLDLFIVLSAIVDTWILSFVTTGGNLQILTVLRIVRLSRLLRMLKLARTLRGVYALVMALASAFGSMSFICLLMIYGVLVYSIFATIIIGRNESFDGILLGSPPNVDTVEDRFGTVYNSMYSLFELMTLEGWQQTARPLVEKQPATFLFIGSFIMIFTFGILNMIVAVVVEKTLEQTRHLQEMEQEDQRREIMRELCSFKQIFKDNDQDGDDSLTFDEFESALAQEDMKRLLEQLNIPVDDAKQLFRVLDWDGAGGVDMKEFVEGLVKIHAEYPSAWDVVATHANVRRLDHRQEQLIEKIEKLETRMGSQDRRQEQLIEKIEKLQTRMDSQNAVTQEVLNILKRTAPYK